MANAINSAGFRVKWCVEATKGTRPSSGYTAIPGCKAVPSFGNEPNMGQSTPLEATKNHTYIRLLDDTGGAINITVNDYTEFRTAWDACVAAYAALTEGKQMWFEYAYPEGSGLDSFYFPGEPLAYGFGGAEVDTIMENNANIAPQGDYEFAAAST